MMFISLYVVILLQWNGLAQGSFHQQMLLSENTYENHQIVRIYGNPKNDPLERWIKVGRTAPTEYQVGTNVCFLFRTTR
jgi:hypothetical protein